MLFNQLPYNNCSIFCSAIKLDAFTNKIRITDAQNEPAQIFARLTSGDLPILGAKIFATVHK